MSEATLPLIPEKVYFRIGEVAELVGVERYVLRYWESEFSQIAPSKSSSQHRMYRREDVALFRAIKRLLYDEKFTIAGAKQKLMQKKPDDLASLPTEVPPPSEMTWTQPPAATPGPDVAEAAPSETEPVLPGVFVTPTLEPTPPPAPVAEAPRGPSPLVQRIHKELLELIQWVEDLEE